MTVSPAGPYETLPAPPRSLSGAHIFLLIGGIVPMILAGGLGAYGTYTNVSTVFPESATALGVVAAGEGATLVLAIAYVLMTLLGQSAPAAVRLGLWILPAVASGTGAKLASDTTEAVVYAVTPMAMCASAEGIGLVARRVVIYRSGIDMEAQRRNAVTMQRLAYERARAAGHPKKGARRRSDLRSWRLARKVGVGDTQLGAGLVTVQRDRMTQGADTALATMFAPVAVPALTASVTPALPAGPGRDGSVTDDGKRRTSGTGSGAGAAFRHAEGKAVTGAVTKGVTQLRDWMAGEASRPRQTVTDDDRAAVTGSGTDTVTKSVTAGRSAAGSVTEGSAAQALEGTVTLEQIASVAGVPTPVTGERLSDPQLLVVLRHLRYREDPPVSYRQAVAAFRDAGYVGGEERVRRTWGDLLSREESETPGAAEPSRAEGDADTDEEDGEGAGPRP
ncbi:hypothetical protein OHA98_39895 [Streptomyces sp. NBC_00654]|uniref:hypothetical protein n=1 Tax=Streptomyces sp. NBC_00654 TaxID=2975799 RepID=UPI0022560F99|nr:hypothetical protein [Streptomyces sp. NBC_00654]MCX4970806.1 hypothetical protein [Streptomyces sp. NBC_00654]